MKWLSPPVFAGLVFSVGALIEYTGYPGATASAHLFYGWAIIYAISFGRVSS
jgi:hypothetical protein